MMPGAWSIEQTGREAQLDRDSGPLWIRRKIVFLFFLSFVFLAATAENIIIFHFFGCDSSPISPSQSVCWLDKCKGRLITAKYG